MFAEVVKLYVNMEELNSTGILDIDNDPVDGSIGEIIFVNMSNVKEFYEVKGYKSERESEEDEWGYDAESICTKLVFNNGEEWAVKETPREIHDQISTIVVVEQEPRYWDGRA